MESLRYSVTLDDLVGFNQFHASHSPTFQRSWRVQTWIYPPIFAGLAVFLSVSAGKLTTVSLVAFLLAIIWPLAVPRYLRWRVAKYARRIYSEGSNVATIGTHEAIAADDGLTVITPGDESRIRWHAIERVSVTPDYAFLYIAANQAVIVPRRAIEEGSFEAFLGYVRRRTSQVIA